MFDACVPHNLYLSQDFASHAASIANLINSEVIHGKEIHLEKDKKDFLKDLLRGIETLSEFDFTDFASGSNNESRQ